MSLLSLPPEILSAIFSYLPPSYLRTSVSNLLVSKAWYAIIYPIYLSDLDFSRLKLANYDLERLPPQGSKLMQKIKGDVERLSIYLGGRGWSKRSMDPWLSFREREEVEDEPEEEEWQWDEFEGGWEADEEINKKLRNLADVLPEMENLRHFALEASLEVKNPLDYLAADVVCRILENLPPRIETLLLNTSATQLLRKGDTDHVCPVIAKRLPQLKQARIRMREICQDICPASGTSSSLPETKPKTEKLIVKLNLPYLPFEHGGHRIHDARVCAPHDRTEDSPFQDVMDVIVTAARKLAKEWDSFKMLRVSYREDDSVRANDRGNVNLLAVDCLKGHNVCDLVEIFFYEDDGRFWDPWEESEGLVQISEV
ncbi:MAG: hypothetical protein LQ342_006029 [Letrouitia transgressa]|nr:MAG: hypothetical protein LQ342_006029 [Letrouitia transgressa]